MRGVRSLHSVRAVGHWPGHCFPVQVPGRAEPSRELLLLWAWCSLGGRQWNVGAGWVLWVLWPWIAILMGLVFAVWVAKSSIRLDVFCMRRAVCFDVSLFLCLCVWSLSLLLKVDGRWGLLLQLLPALLFHLLLSEPRKISIFFPRFYLFLANNNSLEAVYFLHE